MSYHVIIFITLKHAYGSNYLFSKLLKLVLLFCKKVIVYLYTVKLCPFTGVDPENPNYGDPIPMNLTFGVNIGF